MGWFLPVLLLGLFLAASPAATRAEAPAEAVAGFNSYVRSSRHVWPASTRRERAFLLPQDRSVGRYPTTRRRTDHRAADAIGAARICPGAMLHHWRGTAFAPGAKAADFERLMRNFNAYPQRFSPQVVQAKVLRSRRIELRRRCGFDSTTSSRW